MRHKATFTSTSFCDQNIANEYYPNGADDSSVEACRFALMLNGVDAGDIQPIASVTESSPGSGSFDTFNLAGNWLRTPATGDLVVIVASPTSPEIPSTPMSYTNNLVSGTLMQPIIPNLTGSTWLFLVRAESASGLRCPDNIAPIREVYFPGADGTVVLTS